jgi:hypothetical protein
MKLCLVIVFNHRFDKNLPILRKYYGSKFSEIRFLMPFADDLEESETDVISVHFSSYLYQGFFGEARKKLGQIDCDGYVVVGDDLLLNPSLHQENLHQKMELPRGDAYTKSLASLYDAPLSWSRNRITYRALFADGLEWHRLLPNREDALKRSNQYGIKHTPLGLKNLLPLCSKSGLSSLGTAVAWFTERQHSRRLFSIFTQEVPYPLFYGYSDFLVLPKAGWNDFAKYCEATAAMQLFVEAAIPLAMVLAYDHVQTELEYGELFDAPNPKRRMKLRGIELQWQDSDRIDFENQYGLSLTRLMQDFPEDVLYYHPVKLSKWKEAAN